MRSLILISVLLLCELVIAAKFEQVGKEAHLSTYNQTDPFLMCSSKDNSRSERRKQQLEERYRRQSRSSESPLEDTLESSRVTLLFGHVHHAGGTAFCLLARNNTVTNPRDNCNHPDEFKGPPSAPTSGSISQQVAFQRQSPWQFYSVELQMPLHLKYNGPFIYGAILRNPYLLLMSQYRRSQVKFHFKGDLIDLVHWQLKYVGVTTVNFRNHMIYLQQQQKDQQQEQYQEHGKQTGSKEIHLHAGAQSARNYFRGQAGFILGQFGPTNYTDVTIFNMAKRRLKRFSVLALTEFMVESGVVWGDMLGWRVEGFGRKLVNSNGAGDQLVTDLLALGVEDREFVRYYTRVDVLLYGHARCLLERAHYRVTSTGLHSLPPSVRELDAFFAAPT